MNFIRPTRPQEHLRFKNMMPFLWSFVALLVVAAVLLDTPANIVKGLRTIILSESSLITDYVLIAGPGAALMNAAIVTAITLVMLYFSQDTMNGMTPVVLGLMTGFSLFGKNFVNIWPIILGTWCYTVLWHESFAAHINIALMATALSPIVSYVALDNGFGTPIWGALLGFLIGFVMPTLSAHTFRIQNGMNLYNVGFACGMLAFILVPILSSMGADPTTSYHWASGYNCRFTLLLGTLCVLLIIIGLFGCHVSARQAFRGYRVLLGTSGRAPSDYLRMFGPAPVLINTGVNGIIGLTFILMIGGDLNGPTVGGVLTIMGFSAFGKHAKNMLPVMFGVALGGLTMHFDLSAPGVQLACLFCTTLAPISGYFGWPYGILAGFLHSSVVLYTGSPVAGMNLYNNGFSGGLIAIVLYPCILAIIKRRRPVLQDKEYLEQMEEDAPVSSSDTDVVEEKADYRKNRKNAYRHPFE